MLKQIMSKCINYFIKKPNDLDESKINKYLLSKFDFKQLKDGLKPHSDKRITVPFT